MDNEAKQNKPEIKFPFKVSDRVTEAFTLNERKKQAIDLIMRSISEILLEVPDPWEVVFREHPELFDARLNKQMTYSKLTKEINLKTEN